jgi:heme-degrading monooxygenase HmoA
MDPDTRIVVFRSRRHPGHDDAYGRDGERMYALAQTMPGFVAAKDFTAADGEGLSLIEFVGDAELAAWGAHRDHQGVQALGRERYYSWYQLDVCAVVRRSSFDGAAASHRREANDPAALRAIAERWIDCFARADLDALLALYADDAVHSSPKIRARQPGGDGVLAGKPALRAWWRDAFARLPGLRYELTALTSDHARVFMEYVRHAPGEPDLRVAEVLRIERGLIVESRVYHG